MIKKIFILSTLFLTTALSAQAFDYSSYCATDKTAQKTFLGTTNSLIGFNSLTRTIAQSQIEHALKKETGSKFDVSINSFFGTNILDGEFKNLTVTSKSYSYKGFKGSNLSAQTVCPYNKVSFQDNSLVFDEPMVLKYSTDITQEDINQSLLSDDYKKTLEKMNEDKVISSLFKIKNSSIIIRDNRLVFKYEVLPFPKHVIKGLKPIDIIFGANLKVEDNKLQLCDFDLNSIKASSNALLPIINALNPLNHKVKIDKNNKGDLIIENVKIVESKIKLNGYVIINKTNDKKGS